MCRPCIAWDSPHTRGWTRKGVSGWHGTAGFPAHAGMDPRWGTAGCSCCRIPRTRGDGPRAVNADAEVLADSPHTRGWTLHPPGRVENVSGFPAHAGMDPRTRRQGARTRGIPRTRGDGCQQPSRTDEFFDARRCWPGHRSLRVDLDEDEDLGCGRCGKPRSSRFSELPVGALFASMGSVGVHGPGAGGRHGVRVAYERTQTWGEGPVPPTGTLVTVSGSDRPSRSLLLCHGSGSLSSRRPPRALRRRGPAPPTESLSSLQPSLRRLRGVRPRPCLLHTIVSDGSSSPVGSSRQGPPSMQS